MSQRIKRILQKTYLGKYLTVYNKITHYSVPFLYSEFGEILLNSTYSLDTEDNCIVTLGDVFYEHSQDFNKTYKRI